MYEEESVTRFIFTGGERFMLKLANVHIQVNFSVATGEIIIDIWKIHRLSQELHGENIVINYSHTWFIFQSEISFGYTY